MSHDDRLLLNPYLRVSMSEKPAFNLLQTLPIESLPVQQNVDHIKALTHKEDTKYLAQHPEITDVIDLLVNEFLDHKPKHPIKFAEELFSRPNISNLIANRRQRFKCDPANLCNWNLRPCKTTNWTEVIQENFYNDQPGEGEEEEGEGEEEDEEEEEEEGVKVIYKPKQKVREPKRPSSESSTATPKPELTLADILMFRLSIVNKDYDLESRRGYDYIEDYVMPLLDDKFAYAQKHISPERELSPISMGVIKAIGEIIDEDKKSRIREQDDEIELKAENLS